jgi:hypothetical protein
MSDEHARRQSSRDAVAAHFKAHPGEWINASELETIGGRYAWRTRVSEARRQLGMTIENHQERTAMSDGGVFVRSLYRYLEHAPIGPPADQYREQTLFNINDREANR